MTSTPSDPVSGTTPTPPESASPSDPPTHPVDPKRLRRAPDGSLGGVATGVARYFDLDPVIIKIAFVALAVVSGGAAIPVYLAAWLLVPPHDDSDPRPFAIVGGLVPIVIGGVLLVAGLSSIFGSFRFGTSLTLSALLVGAGFLLLNQRSESSTDEGEPTTDRLAWARPRPPAPSPPPPAPQPASYEYAIPQPAPVAGGLATAPATATRPTVKEPKPPVTAVTLAVGAVLIAVLAFLDQVAGLDVSAWAYFGLSTAVIGAGLIVSSVVGRALALIPLGLLSLTGLALSPLVDTSIDGGFGAREVTVIDPADLEPYDLGAGSLELDLTQLELEEDTTVTIDVGAGVAIVTVPPSMNVSVVSSTDFGVASVFGEDLAGIDNTSRAGRIVDDDGPTLTIEADISFGVLEVE